MRSAFLVVALIFCLGFGGMTAAVAADSGFDIFTAVSFLTMPELVKLLLHSRAQAMLYGVLARFAWYRRSMQHLRYDF